MADDFRPGDDDRSYHTGDARPERYGRRSRRVMTALIAVAAVLGFGVVLVYAYNKGREAGESRVPPVIQAQDGPTKVRPETPGGMEVPHRDKEIFNRLEAGEQTDKVERLLPPPEKPMDRPVAPPEPPERMDQMETAAGGELPAPPPASPAPPTAAPSPPAQSAPSPPAQSAAAPPEPAPAPKNAEPAPEPPSPAQKPETRTAAKTPAPSTSTASTGRWKIQLASLKSEGAARQSWSALQKKNRDVLGDLSLHIERIVLSGGKGTYYRVQAGPVGSRAAAGDLCSRLKARKQGCLVVAP